MHRMARLLAPLTAVLFVILTSSDVTTLVMVALHLPPPLALEAALLLGVVLLLRGAWRRWMGRAGPVSGPTAIAAIVLAILAYPQTVVLLPLTPWLRLTLPGLK
ncbi:MAG TPA: hypothetical protein VOB72_10100 [Candidatus Dormibacteraeota bacterium]|nr:hypothetical protein [Candidatus Dormibacteraeota bacterium]